MGIPLICACMFQLSVKSDMYKNETGNRNHVE